MARGGCLGWEQGKGGRNAKQQHSVAYAEQVQPQAAGGAAGGCGPSFGGCGTVSCSGGVTAGCGAGATAVALASEPFEPKGICCPPQMRAFRENPVSESEPESEPSSESEESSSEWWLWLGTLLGQDGDGGLGCIGDSGSECRECSNGQRDRTGSAVLGRGTGPGLGSLGSGVIDMGKREKWLHRRVARSGCLWRLGRAPVARKLSCSELHCA